MASAADEEETLCSTYGKENFQRLTRLLMCGGGRLLRETFDAIHLPKDLPLKLGDPAIRSQLNKAKLSRAEWSCLYPSPGTFGKSTDFDITLTFRLLRTICNLTAPVTGWNSLPVSADVSLEADLARIKFFRNSIYGHNQKMEISDSELCYLWKEVSEALLRIAGNLGPLKADEWKKSIDRLLTDPLTPEAQSCVEELELWYKKDMDLKGSVEHLKDQLHQVNIDVKDQFQKFNEKLDSILITFELERFSRREQPLAHFHESAGMTSLSTHELQPQSAVAEVTSGGNQRNGQNPFEEPDIWKVILSFKESFTLLLQYLSKQLKLRILNYGTGSLCITVACSSLEILEGLWKDYSSSHLNTVAERILFTSEALERLCLSEVKLRTVIKEEDYNKHKQFLVDIDQFKEGRGLKSKSRKAMINVKKMDVDASQKPLRRRDSIFGYTDMENSSVYDQTFRGEGTKFNCKLVGITDVVRREGENMCAEAFKQLKVLAKKKREHKQKVALFVSLAGVRIVDENTKEVQYIHPVKIISYVTIDLDESKIFGYVCSQPNCPTGYQFYALKSQENARVIVDAMVELFQVSFNLRQDHPGSAKKQFPNSSLPALSGSVEFIAQLQQMELDASKVNDKKELKIELKKIASDKGFRIVDNEGSGNCMYYALSDQLEIAMRIKIKHGELRQILVQYLRKNPKLPNGTNLFHFVHGHQSWADYLTYMEQDGAWGDHVILCAAANCYKTCIRVVSSLNAAHDVIVRPQCPVDVSRTLVLGHIHEVHYVSLRSTQEKETELREMETLLTNLQGQPRGKEKELQAKEKQNLSFQTICNTTNQPMEEKIRQEENLYLKLRALEEQLAYSQGQLREKELEQANLLREKEQQHITLHQKLTNLEGQLREKELLKNSMQEQLNRKMHQVGNLEEQLKTKDRERIEIERSLSTAQSALRVHRAQIVTLERQLMTKDQEKHELERTLATAQQVLRAENQAQNLPDWAIPFNQIQLTEKVLGSGAWGEVVEGKYCGYAVAVKRIHNTIISVHNRRLFEREMDIASRCRHPCLLQFIGTTNIQGRPMIVTELMESSLRALLERRSLSETEVSVISIDVARALSYLHQKRPSPILHRDISSANVLLCRQGNQWRAKVSDYGTANFKQQTMTVAPGTPIYSAPEAHTSDQTPKLDVYSFGVLLCEMCIRELPYPERREQQVALVTQNVLRALIRRCLQPRPQARPSMQQIIDELEQSS